MNSPTNQEFWKRHGFNDKSVVTVRDLLYAFWIDSQEIFRTQISCLGFRILLLDELTPDTFSCEEIISKDTFDQWERLRVQPLCFRKFFLERIVRIRETYHQDQIKRDELLFELDSILSLMGTDRSSLRKTLICNLEVPAEEEEEILFPLQKLSLEGISRLTPTRVRSLCDQILSIGKEPTPLRNLYHRAVYHGDKGTTKRKRQAEHHHRQESIRLFQLYHQCVKLGVCGSKIPEQDFHLRYLEELQVSADDRKETTSWGSWRNKYFLGFCGEREKIQYYYLKWCLQKFLDYFSLVVWSQDHCLKRIRSMLTKYLPSDLTRLILEFYTEDIDIPKTTKDSRGYETKLISQWKKADLLTWLDNKSEFLPIRKQLSDSSEEVTGAQFTRMLSQTSFISPSDSKKIWDALKTHVPMRKPIKIQQLPTNLDIQRWKIEWIRMTKIFYQHYQEASTYNSYHYKWEKEDLQRFEVVMRSWEI